MASLLVYIPAYKTHLKLAIDQAIKLRNQWDANSDFRKTHKIEIYLSINGLDSDLNVPDGLFDYLYHSRINIGWDNNMNKGFTEALNIRPDYFWLLSCDDSVSDTAIETIFNAFDHKSNPKLVVTKNDANFDAESISKILDLPLEYSLGLISSVVYDFKSCESAFPNSFYFGWSGWGQLAVLLKILDINKIIEVICVDSKLLYSRIKYEDKNILNRNISKYQHSYYGNLLLRLAQDNGKFHNKKIIIRWVISNIHLHNFFASVSWPPMNEQDAPETTNWRKNYVSSIIKGNSILCWMIYVILSKVPLKSIINKS